MRALLILLLNPIFSAQSTYTVFAHVLQTITNLSNGDHQLLVHWFRSLETDRLGGIVRQEAIFVTIRLMIDLQEPSAAGHHQAVPSR